MAATFSTLLLMALPSAVADKLSRAQKAISELFSDEADAAERLGIPYTTLRRALRPEENPVRRSGTWEKRLDEIGDALKTKMGVSPDWWQVGTGDMLLPGQGDVGPGEPPAPPDEIPPPLRQKLERAEELVRPPIVEVTAGDGTEVEINPVGYGEPMPAYLIRQLYHIEPAALCYLRVRGSSMDGEPARIPPGAILRGKIMDPGERVIDNAVYVVAGPTGLQLKRIKFVDRMNGHVERFVCLWSDNPEAGRDLIPLEVFQRDYRAVIAVLTAEKYL